MENVRRTFTATFIRKGKCQNFKGRSSRILLKNIKDDRGLMISKEIWVNETKIFKELENLKYGDKIEFVAYLKENTVANGLKKELSRISSVNILQDDSTHINSHLNSYNDDINAILNSFLSSNN